MKTQEQKDELTRQIELLRKKLKPGSTVYTVLRKVSSSGMSRQISCLISSEKGKIEDISYLVASAIDCKRNPDNGALKIGGCGMDMGFHVVYSLGRVLFPKGFKLAPGQYGRNGDKSGFDTNGGYALNQQWI